MMQKISPKRTVKFAKQRIKALLRLTAVPWLTGPAITEDLRRLGVRWGGILLVHSSLSSLGYVRGGAQTVINSMLQVLGPSGTLVLPTHSWHAMECGSRLFDVRHTPSCVGALTECFRNMPGVMRSLHPTHSVGAFGPLAESITEGHERSTTPCGPDTPYLKILEKGGQVLFLGVGLEANTAFHTIEAIVKVPYLMMSAPDSFTIIDRAGATRALSVWRHKAGVPRRFREMEGTLIDNGILKSDLVGRGRCLLLEGKPFLSFMTEQVTRVSNYLLSDSAASTHNGRW